jgi:tRNA(fMet)-specific endonuclease VapC
MSTVLLDTTIASLLHPKKKGSTIRSLYEPHMQGNILAISFQSVAELWAWAELNNWGAKQRSGLDLFIQKFLIIPYDAELSKSWAKVKSHCKKVGRPIESGDTWIVATAIYYKIPLLTHDYDQTKLGITDLNVISYV